MSKSLLINRNTNPAAGVNLPSNVNVGGFGWTTAEAAHVSQLIQYVDLVRKYADTAEQGAEYVRKAVDEFVAGAIDDLNEVKEQIYPMYEDIVNKHTDVGTWFNAIRVMYDEVMSADARVMLKASETDTNASIAVSAATAGASYAIRAEDAYQKSEDLYMELAKGMVYRGLWNPNSGAYPTNKTTNATWDVILEEDELEHSFDNITWYWGDRLLYLKEEDQFFQVESGTTVQSINGKKGAVTLTARDVGALPASNGVVTGNVTFNGNVNFGDGFALTHATWPVAGNEVANKSFTEFAITQALTNFDLKGYVTTDTLQDITGVKSFKSNISATAGVNFASSTSVTVPTPQVRSQAVNKGFADDTYLPFTGGDVTGKLRTVAGFDTNGWPNATNSDANNYINRARFVVSAGNNGLHFIGDGKENARRFGIQSGHKEGLYASSYGILDLNPYGGAVRINGYTAFHEGNLPTPNLSNYINKTETGQSVAGLTSTAGFTANNSYHSTKTNGTFATMNGQSDLIGLNATRGTYINSTGTNGFNTLYSGHNGSGPSVRIADNYYKLYHEGNKPTAADVGSISATDDNIVTGSLTIQTNEATFKPFIAERGTHIGKFGVGLPLTGDFGAQIGIAAGTGTNWMGITEAGKAYTHVNNTPREIPTAPLSTTLASQPIVQVKYTLTAPAGAAAGTWYPVRIALDRMGSRISITTNTGGGSLPMNNCCFSGYVKTGGWSDQGTYMDGTFHIYDATERAIGCAATGTESVDHVVFYVEGRGFPVQVICDSHVAVPETGTSVGWGTSVYNTQTQADFAGAGTKTRAVINFARGQGQYSSAPAAYTAPGVVWTGSVPGNTGVTIALTSGLYVITTADGQNYVNSLLWYTGAVDSYPTWGSQVVSHSGLQIRYLNGVISNPASSSYTIMQIAKII